MDPGFDAPKTVSAHAARCRGAGRPLLCALAAIAIAGARPAAAAGDAPDLWQFSAFLDIFIPTNISTTTTYPPSGGSGGISADGSRILSGLNMAFIGGFEAMRAPWGIYMHLLYVDLGNTKTGSRTLEINGQPLPAGVDATTRYDFRGSFYTLTGTYRAVADPERTLDLLFGARFLHAHNALDWTLSGNLGSIPPPSRSGFRSSERSSSASVEVAYGAARQILDGGFGERSAGELDRDRSRGLKSSWAC